MNATQKEQSDLRLQTTREGSRAVTVGRYGDRMAKAKNGQTNKVYTTKVYRAVRRQDGVLTWRLVAQVNRHSTSGNDVTAPMIARAREYATARRLPLLAWIIHGTVCG